MSKFIAAFLLLNIAFSSAVFLKKPTNSHFNTMSQLREISEKDFGKRILDTIAL
jgi:regulatory protein YycI of two-component signal transduction system YycFG